MLCCLTSRYTVMLNSLFSVFTFCDEKEALSAISKKPESFHVAIVEVVILKLNISVLHSIKIVKFIVTWELIDELLLFMGCIIIDISSFYGFCSEDVQVNSFYQA